tara:strand:- start:70 stop:339 length:270 start_codon:yes stop_codon:yes gene_type:complete
MINITKVCKDANWHLATAKSECHWELSATRDLGWDDAEAFVNFVFADHAPDCGDRPHPIGNCSKWREHLTKEQWDRLELDGTDWCIKED